MKALRDALKVRTTGRRDRIYLHYFGAMVDDGPGFVEATYEQELVPDPKDAGVRIQVLPSMANTKGRRTRGRRSVPASLPSVTIE